MENVALFVMTLTTGFFLGVLACVSVALYIEKIQEMRRDNRQKALRKKLKREADENKVTIPDFPHQD